jgi:hypothetical protein
MPARALSVLESTDHSIVNIRGPHDLLPSLIAGPIHRYLPVPESYRAPAFEQGASHGPVFLPYSRW